MGKQYKHITKTERLEIAILLEKNYSYREIAKSLQRSVSSISEEINNNSTKGQYNPLKANHKAYVKRKYSKYQGKKINENEQLEQYIINGLENNWSPDEISGRMKREQQPFYSSKTAIYEWLHSERGQKYCQYLYSKRYKKKKRKKKKTKKQMIPNRVSIEKRPNGAKNRTRYGHLEGDTIVSSKNGKGGIAVIQDRKSRYIDAKIIQTLKPAENVIKINSMIYNKKTLTITMDNGIENKLHEQLPIQAYFCNPYSSWQKGSIENANKMIRRYFPKGTDFSKVKQSQLDTIINLINQKPRKILGYQTAAEVAIQSGYIKYIIN